MSQQLEFPFVSRMNDWVAPKGPDPERKMTSRKGSPSAHQDRHGNAPTSVWGVWAKIAHSTEVFVDAGTTGQYLTNLICVCVRDRYPKGRDRNCLGSEGLEPGPKATPKGGRDGN